MAPESPDPGNSRIRGGGPVLVKLVIAMVHVSARGSVAWAARPNVCLASSASALTGSWGTSSLPVSSCETVWDTQLLPSIPDALPPLNCSIGTEHPCRGSPPGVTRNGSRRLAGASVGAERERWPAEDPVVSRGLVAVRPGWLRVKLVGAGRIDLRLCSL